MTDRVFPSLAVVSATSGIALCEGFRISTMHEIIEHILGHPVWTHELPEAGRRADEVLRRQFPDLPTREAAEADWQEVSRQALVLFGANMTIARGSEQRSTDPVTTLREKVGDKPIIVINEDSPDQVS